MCIRDSYIGVMGHLDVVETGEGWTHPPFSGYTDENGRIFSRGILDNKGPVLSCLYALYALKRLHIPLSRQVRIMFGTVSYTHLDVYKRQILAIEKNTFNTVS